MLQSGRHDRRSGRAAGFDLSLRVEKPPHAPRKVLSARLRRDASPLHVAKSFGNGRISLLDPVDGHRHHERGALGSEARALGRQSPFQAEIPFGPSLRVHRDDGNEKRAVAYLLPNGPVPRVPAAQLALIEPDLDTGSAQGLADVLRRRGVLPGTAHEYRARRLGQRPTPDPLVAGTLKRPLDRSTYSRVIGREFPSARRLRFVAAAKFFPSGGVMADPLTQLIARRDLSHPLRDGCIRFLHSAGPEAIDENSGSIARRRSLVDALDVDGGSGLVTRGFPGTQSTVSTRYGLQRSAALSRGRSRTRLSQRARTTCGCATISPCAFRSSVALALTLLTP
jgi:hypothetical protein